MREVVIIGNGRLAELRYFRLLEAGGFRIQGFVVDREFINAPTLQDLPVSAFDDISGRYPPDRVEVMMGIGHVKCNRVRAERFESLRAQGYRFVTYISPAASVSPQARIGEGCSIGAGALIGPQVHIGDDVVVGTRCIVNHHCTIEDHVFMAVNVVTAGNVRVEAFATLGAGVTLRDGIRIGRDCVIGAGATILEDTPEKSVWIAPAAERLPISSDRLPGRD